MSNPSSPGPTDHYEVLIVGGGMAADAAARGLREQAFTGTIGILERGHDAPFPRPALSKDLWAEDADSLDDSFLGTSEATGASVHLGTEVTGLDATGHTVTCADGGRVGYDRLLLAPGGSPRTLDGLSAGPRVVYFRTPADYRAVRTLLADQPGAEVVVVGAGYIGSEIAAALSGEDCSVQIVHPGEVLGDVMLPRTVAERLESRLVQAGVQPRGGREVTGGRVDGDRVHLTLDDDSSLDADLVVVGLGVEPPTSFLRGTLDLADDGGVVVDERLATSAPDVWAAGDAVIYPDPVLGRTRVEHEDHATSSGAAAGRIMAGSEEVYDHTPFFYSDVIDLGYQGMGVLDPSMETFVDVVDGEQDAAVVYYLDDDAVRGVLMWNLFADLEQARSLLAEKARPADAADLAGRITQ
ncbi:NAD(P)/FAD-dependent oxidoreductase [Nocardioides acrostichi]|uniref:NAD(P)/FAD-dependent oxidoreductase n=1 Tax=Nocardioides acrostichi TaxID=2784339 RepID=A0A930UXG3_9ACTN|nr:FAD/NAD(P)-binding oxidoreductase [Nocardioides acrostichi]MBF4160855.1 NAD(P)/FAD-dependent oxidoreductase [Nocardioides acrostichi]